MKNFISNTLFHLCHPSDSVIGIGTGISSSGVYLYMNNITLQLQHTNFIEFSILVMQAALIAFVGGFCGLLGKEIYIILKNWWNK